MPPWPGSSARYLMNLMHPAPVPYLPTRQRIICLNSSAQAPGAVLWVGEQDGTLVGCCGIYPTEGLPPETVELVKFYVNASARGRGIGWALLEKSLESAREIGYRHRYLESLPVFGKSVSLYEQQDFRRLDQRLGNSGYSSW